MMSGVPEIEMKRRPADASGTETPWRRPMRPSRVLTVSVVLCSAVIMARAAGQTPTQEQRPPVFRAGATFVNVDAYPRRDGKVVDNLKAGDFEILEDGKPQAVESFEFVRIAPNTPDAERRDPNSVADANRQAADPHNRVFVVYLDPYHTTIVGSHETRRPVVEFLTRAIGPTDLFGFMTPDTPVAQLTFGRRIDTIASELDKYWAWGQDGFNRPTFTRDEMERRLNQCDFEGKLGLIPLHREDRLSTSLADLMARLGSLRDERKNLLLISEGWAPREGAMPGASGLDGPPPMPRVGVSSSGRLGLGNDPSGGRDRSWCESEIGRLRGIDFVRRFRDLLTQAAQANVSVFPIDVGGLKTGTPTADGDNNSSFRQKQETLRTLAGNTDGTVVMDTNDLTGAARKIADDLSAYYLLGYYSTNTAADGRFRRIEVKVKQNGVRTTARRGYMAPTAEMRRAADAAAGSPKAEPSSMLTDELGRLGRLRPDATIFGYGIATPTGLELVAEIAAREAGTGRWAGGGTVAMALTSELGAKMTTSGVIEAGARGVIVRVPVEKADAAPWRVVVRMTGSVGDALEETFEIVPVAGALVGATVAFRGTPSARSVLRPVADFQFRRTERLHVEWIALQSLDDRSARLLNGRGEPVALPLSVTERIDGDRTRLAVDLLLSPLPEADYVIELTAGRGAARETRLMAFRVVR
jgi:VWFA-related protein